jgi:hypothetical protein
MERKAMSQVNAGDSVEFTGHPLDLGWIPHTPETWTHRYASLKADTKMSYFRGHCHTRPEYDEEILKAGTRVKIVMVSRLGDVGITGRLDTDNGYGARVALEALCGFTRS